MARIKAPDQQMRNADNVPAELFDGDSISWHSALAFREWINRCTNGIADAELAALDRPSAGCWQRRRRALIAWAVTVGLVNPRWPEQPDWEALERLGLPAGVGSSIERVRRQSCPVCRRLGIPVWADRKDD